VRQNLGHESAVAFSRFWRHRPDEPLRLNGKDYLCINDAIPAWDAENGLIVYYE